MKKTDKKKTRPVQELESKAVKKFDGYDENEPMTVSFSFEGSPKFRCTENCTAFLVEKGYTSLTAGVEVNKKTGKKKLFLNFYTEDSETAGAINLTAANPSSSPDKQWRFSSAVLASTVYEMIDMKTAIIPLIQDEEYDDTLLMDLKNAEEREPSKKSKKVVEEEEEEEESKPAKKKTTKKKVVEVEEEEEEDEEEDEEDEPKPAKKKAKKEADKPKSTGKGGRKAIVIDDEDDDDDDSDDDDDEEDED